MKLNSKSILNFKKRRVLAIVFGAGVLFLSLVSFSQVRAYEIIVDNNVDADSDIDSSPNVGTDGATSYTDAQSQDDSDQVIVEADTGGAGTNEYLVPDNVEAGIGGWDASVGTSPWIDIQDEPTNYIWTDANNQYTGWFTFGSTSGSGTGFTVNMSYYHTSDGDSYSDWELDWTGDGIAEASGSGTNQAAYAWEDLGTISGLDIATEIDACRVRFQYHKGGGASDDHFVDAVRLGVSKAGASNYELDWEHSVTSVDTDKDFHVLTFYAQATGGDSETFSIYLWDLIAVDWVDTGQDIGTSETWYNWTITVGFADCIGSSMYVNYQDNIPSSDTTQSTLNVDYMGIRSYNFSIYGLENFDSLTFSPDNTYHAFIDNPIQFVVETGQTYDVEIRATDLTGTPITDGWIFFNTVDDSGTSTLLTTSFQTLYSGQAIGNNTHNIYLWVNLGWTAGDAGITNQQYQFTLIVDITGV